MRNLARLALLAMVLVSLVSGDAGAQNSHMYSGFYEQVQNPAGFSGASCEVNFAQCPEVGANGAVIVFCGMDDGGINDSWAYIGYAVCADGICEAHISKVFWEFKKPGQPVQRGFAGTPGFSNEFEVKAVGTSFGDFIEWRYNGSVIKSEALSDFAGACMSRVVYSVETFTQDDHIPGSQGTGLEVEFRNCFFHVAGSPYPATASLNLRTKQVHPHGVVSKIGPGDFNVYDDRGNNNPDCQN